MSAWASDKPCTIPDCERRLVARGMCKVHYDRWSRHGDPQTVLKPLSARGAPLAWIASHVGHDGDGCLIWPFSRYPDGRANMSGAKPTRVMCERAHGPAPTPTHEAAHSCGKGHEGCVHPLHLRWATPVENAADKGAHGTIVVGEAHYAAKLNEADVRAIRAMRGHLLQREIAAQYGVNISCVNKILNGKSWRHTA